MFKYFINLFKDIFTEDATRPISKPALRRELREACTYYEVTPNLKAVIEFLIREDHSGRWDMIDDFDGATIVIDLEPKVNLAAFVHDFLFVQGYSLTDANTIFSLIMTDIHTHPIINIVRLLGVTIATPYFHFRNMHKRNWKWKPANLPRIIQRYLDGKH